MSCRVASTGVSAILTVLLAVSASAQSLMQPTPPPVVTADNEAWYLNGDPVTHAGNLYYPAGAQVFFNSNEMVRSGFHMGVPLYTRTTIEPYSLVYVPLSGRRMQPYERKRSGELVGTAGSQPASLLTPYDPRSAADLVPQAPGPPARGPIVVTLPYPVAARDEMSSMGAADDPGVASGTSSRPDSSSRPRHVRIGGRPQGINAIYIDYANARWYSTGRALPVDIARMTRVEDYRGFPVWRDNTELIYVAATRNGTVVVPYSLRKPADWK